MRTFPKAIPPTIGAKIRVRTLVGVVEGVDPSEQECLGVTHLVTVLLEGDERIQVLWEIEHIESLDPVETFHLPDLEPPPKVECDPFLRPMVEDIHSYQESPLFVCWATDLSFEGGGLPFRYAIMTGRWGGFGLEWVRLEYFKGRVQRGTTSSRFYGEDAVSKAVQAAKTHEQKFRDWWMKIYQPQPRQG